MKPKPPRGAPSDTPESPPATEHPAPETPPESAPAARPRLGVRRAGGGDESEAPRAPRNPGKGVRGRFRTGMAKPTISERDAKRPPPPPEQREQPRERVPERARSSRPRTSQRDGERRERRHDEARVKPAPVATRADAEGVRAVAEGVRLSKVMAERGLCSRREADGIIERGWVFVDGRRISELGTRIDPDAEITLAPEAERRQAAQVTILLHKPVGYVSGQPEPGYEPAVTLVNAETQFDSGTARLFHPSHLRGLAPAGRLDIDSTGLLVLTQDGRIARQLIGEGSKVEKEYIVRVEGPLDEDGLALLNHGLELDGRKLRPARVEWINDDQLRFFLREGRKRQIRRMCELVGLRVVGLKRTRIGNVKLSDLPLGAWRFLREDEHF